MGFTIRRPQNIWTQVHRFPPIARHPDCSSALSQISRIPGVFSVGILVRLLTPRRTTVSTSASPGFIAEREGITMCQTGNREWEDVAGVQSGESLELSVQYYMGLGIMI